jgi:hypothetical protein
MPTTHCQNPVCSIPLEKQSTDSCNNKAFLCATCNKYFCSNCINITPNEGKNIPVCIYCLEKLTDIEKNDSIPDEENVALSVEQRLSMGEYGQEINKTFCLKCFHEVLVYDLTSLSNTSCKKCGASCFMDAEGNTYKGNNNTFVHSEESNNNFFQNFMVEYVKVKTASIADPLNGKVTLNNWLYKNIFPISLFQIPNVLKEQNPDEAAVFENALNQFKI